MSDKPTNSKMRERIISRITASWGRDNSFAGMLTEANHDCETLLDRLEAAELSNSRLLEHMSAPLRNALDALEAAQAKIDMLMIEYCPEEMTDEQRDRWANCQVPPGDEIEAEIKSALEHRS